MSLFIQDTLATAGLVVFIAAVAFISFGVDSLLYGPLP